MILFVDDDAEDIELFYEAVQKIDNSCVCVTAHNGKDALRLLNTISPDMIFLDINMPIMDGKETLQRIQKDVRLREIPVCVLSTTANPYEIEQYKKMGATACLTKPNSFEGLLSTLKHLFKHSIH